MKGKEISSSDTFDNLYGNCLRLSKKMQKKIPDGIAKKETNRHLSDLIFSKAKSTQNIDNIY